MLKQRPIRVLPIRARTAVLARKYQVPSTVALVQQDGQATIVTKVGNYEYVFGYLDKLFFVVVRPVACVVLYVLCGLLSCVLMPFVRTM